jgi:hypothetical protein
MSRKSLVPVNVPALASAPTIPTLRTGDLYFNTVDDALYVYSGTSWIASGSGSSGAGESNSFEVLSDPPASPAQGRVYFDSSENTIKVYNGNIWYDVAGPKSLLDHQHYAGDGFVRHVDYGQYVSDLNYIVSMDGGTASTSYSLAPDNDIIDGGAA